MKISRRKTTLYICFNIHEITFMLCSMTMFHVLKVKNVSVKSKYVTEYIISHYILYAWYIKAHTIMNANNALV